MARLKTGSYASCKVVVACRTRGPPSLGSISSSLVPETSCSLRMKTERPWKWWTRKKSVPWLTYQSVSTSCFSNLQGHADLQCEPTRTRPKIATIWEGILKSEVDTALRNMHKLMISTPRTGPHSLCPQIPLSFFVAMISDTNRNCLGSAW